MISNINTIITFKVINKVDIVIIASKAIIEIIIIFMNIRLI